MCQRVPNILKNQNFVRLKYWKTAQHVSTHGGQRGHHITSVFQVSVATGHTSATGPSVTLVQLPNGQTVQVHGVIQAAQPSVIQSPHVQAVQVGVAYIRKSSFTFRLVHSDSFSDWLVPDLHRGRKRGFTGVGRQRDWLSEAQRDSVTTPLVQVSVCNVHVCVCVCACKQCFLKTVKINMLWWCSITKAKKLWLNTNIWPSLFLLLLFCTF